ncbi:nucleotidyl transferase AbiEii/AbiGii toxin family protein [Noviherbaspirillum sedimenti]|uniref:Nucleotidyltransferase n=1 Tax=Noviherbaspirillum sedimenti TaxID=2320865 RepID=A0A3A3G326_9BURK|nr:nucleotidyl transferase AbiEii/AbiGii toxin family protein [Noviherbaspirillum sedimenti]RJG02877.1 hypothetical protein D3878_15885 [Noviherbaspirillum sedimenti]
MSLDFSRKPELAPLAAVVRDLMLRHAHGIAPGRQTEDVDFAVMVRDWEAFAALRAALLASGDFAERPGAATHRLRHQATGLPLDIVPFGGIERADRTILWPPDQSTVFDCFGVSEAFAASQSVRMPDGVSLRVASIPALALLKVTAWQDRKHSTPGRDAGDLLLYLRHYMDCGNLDRAARDHGDLFAADDYDHEAAGARLLGRDIALLLDRQAIQHVLDILLPQADPHGQLLLAQQSGLDLEHARRLIEAVCNGLAEI